MSMVNTTNNSTEDKILKLQSSEVRTKVKFYKSISNYYDEMEHKNLQFKKILLVKMLKVLVNVIMKF